MVLKRVGLTGASGLLGAYVLRRLETEPAAGVATSRKKPKNLPQNVSWFSWDLTQEKNAEELDAAFGPIQALIHLGAVIPKEGISDKEFFETNARPVSFLGQWALKRGIYFVHVSSAAVYASPERSGIHEKDARIEAKTASPYASSKSLAEQYLEQLAAQGLRACILRPSSLYGSGLPDNKMIPKFLAMAMRGETIELKPPVHEKINLVHAQDVIEAIFLAIKTEVTGIFNIPGPGAYSIEEIGKTCVEVSGRGRVSLPAEKVSGEAPVRFGLSGEKAKREMGYEAKIDLRKGLAEMRGAAKP